VKYGHFRKPSSASKLQHTSLCNYNSAKDLLPVCPDLFKLYQNASTNNLASQY